MALMRTWSGAIVATVAFLSLAACGRGDGGDAAPAGPDPSTSTLATVEPTTSAAGPPTSSPADLLAAGECPTVARSEPDPDRPRYTAVVDADPSTGQVTGTMGVAFTPDLDLDRVVFRLWPNAPRPAARGVRLSVTEVRLDGAPLDFAQPDPTTLDVPLPTPATAGATLDLQVEYDLKVPGPAPDRVSRQDDSLRLGSFLPLLPWVPGEGWALEPPTSLFAEATTSPTADFDVEIRVPAGYDVLATGVPDGRGVWSAVAVRDFAASIGHFEQVTLTAHAPDEVLVTVGVHQGLGQDPAAYGERVVAALEDFGTRFGAYPWPVLTLAITPGLQGGIEFPSHIMQGPGTLGRTTPHEVGHMWFYGLVGNNQGAEPWLDEGLASYAEGVFEGKMDEFASQPIPDSATGHLGDPLTYWAQHEDDYYDGVYIQGAQAVHALGTRDQVDCALRYYVATHAFGLVDSGDLVETFEALLPGSRPALADFGVVG